jgi:hypothetical protein
VLWKPMGLASARVWVLRPIRNRAPYAVFNGGSSLIESLCDYSALRGRNVRSDCYIAFVKRSSQIE